MAVVSRAGANILSFPEAEHTYIWANILFSTTSLHLNPVCTYNRAPQVLPPPPILDTPLGCTTLTSNCPDYPDKPLAEGLAKNMQSGEGSNKRRYDRGGRGEAPSKHGEKAIEQIPQLRRRAHYYERRGKWDQAEKLRLRILRICLRWLGDEHQDTFDSKQDLANVHMQQRRFDLAAPLQLQILDFRKRLYGDDHPDTIESKHILACIYAKQYRLEEAKELELAVLSAWKRDLGEEHPKTHDATQILIAIMYKQDQKKQPHTFRQPSRKGTADQPCLEATQGTSRPTEIDTSWSQQDMMLFKSLVQTGLAQIAHSPTGETPTNKEVHESSGPIPMSPRGNSGDESTSLYWEQHRE
ncbi:hypothetical protein FRC10_002574 [Ceratobasidium sp. 414]|nr:hypothetical protein FRC10_002574 [Ceratobasidium sp. 414]